MCDAVYVLVVDRLDRVAFAALSAGAEVDPDEQRRQFDEWLSSEPELIAAEVADLNRALGIGRWRR